MSSANTATSIAHHALQQRGGLDGFGALALQSVAERVDLVHHEIDGAAGATSGAANRVVPFTQCPEEVGLQKKRASDHLIGERGGPDPDREDDGGDRPPDFETVVLAPGQE
jgi:hypothetical protein